MNWVIFNRAYLFHIRQCCIAKYHEGPCACAALFPTPRFPWIPIGRLAATSCSQISSFTSVGISLLIRPNRPNRIFTIFALPRSLYRSNAWTDSSQIVRERGCLCLWIGISHFWLALYRQGPCPLRHILDITNTENTITRPKHRLSTSRKK